MRYLNALETAALLPYGTLAKALAVMLHGQSANSTRAPERLAVPLPSQGTLLVMTAADDELAVTKLVTVHPKNKQRGLETIQGECILIKSATGLRVAALDGPTVTSRRTAALSLLAAKTLAPQSKSLFENSSQPP